MNAIKFILSEHGRIKKRLVDITKKNRTTDSKQKMFVTLSKYLAHHEKTEEKIWYSYLRKNTTLSSVIKTLVAEEKAAGKAIAKMKKTQTPVSFDKQLLKLKAAVLKHASHEEKKLLPKAAKLVDKKDLVIIGKKMQKFKKSLDQTKK